MQGNPPRLLRLSLVSSRDLPATDSYEQRDRSVRAFRPHAYLWALLFIIASVWTTSASAQSVHWQTGDSGDPSELQLIFENCAPEGDPQLPQIDGTTLALVGTSS